MRPFWTQAFTLVFKCLILLFVVSIFLVGLHSFLPVGMTPLMVLRASEKMFSGKAPKVEKDWVALEEMSPQIQYAVIAAEDRRFFEHYGFDFEAIDQAYRYNLRHKKVRGASTISQQVAKNLFLWPQRSYLRKALEAYFTGLIELFWSKQRILEVYLNIIELGDGVYGVQAASQKFFKKSAQKINAPEAALLAAVLPNPRKFLVSSPSNYIRFRQTMIQRRMRVVARTLPK